MGAVVGWGTFRDSNGSILESFSIPIGRGLPMQAKILALDHAIKFFIGLICYKSVDLVLECDCEVVVNWLRMPSSIPAECGEVLPPIFDTIARKNFVVKYSQGVAILQQINWQNWLQIYILDNVFFAGF
ncbi:hypothetical protein F3Y22_tig00111099pilonHSYRG00134 [Hibiscus syriacus]|uniref:RNase H type-1 domain-containing protein n=1 Tax=Hibiscus syriacus TaxID=106335 RepID=A0A6A2Z168_HIBSY|nr:hypothetical protein F3Y22_tig00111099pilonHSYRG00134 [Hibiscus syriacus]